MASFLSLNTFGSGVELRDSLAGSLCVERLESSSKDKIKRNKCKVDHDKQSTVSATRFIVYLVLVGV